MTDSQELNSGITVTSLLRLVKKALEEAQSKIASGSGLPPLSSVDLTLETALKDSGGVDGELFVVSGGISKDETATQTLSIKLGKPKPSGPGFALTRDVESEIYRDLVAAVVAAAKAGKEAYETMPPGLDLNSISASVGFEVIEEKKSGFKFKIFNLSAGSLVARTKTGSQKIELCFEK